MVRGQLPGLRGRPTSPAGHRRRPAAPHQVQASGEELGRATILPIVIRWGGVRVAGGGVMSISPVAHDPSGPSGHLPTFGGEEFKMQTGNGMRWPFTMPQDILGIRFAFNVAIATAIVWYSLKYIADTNPIWAIASMVAASDPQVNEAAAC